jgi:hypothetical protein
MQLLVWVRDLAETALDCRGAWILVATCSVVDECRQILLAALRAVACGRGVYLALPGGADSAVVDWVAAMAQVDWRNQGYLIGGPELAGCDCLGKGGCLVKVASERSDRLGRGCLHEIPHCDRHYLKQLELTEFENPVRKSVGDYISKRPSTHGSTA